MSKKAKIIIVAAVLVLAAAIGIVYACFAPKGITGGKTIDVLVVHGDGSEKSFKIKTDAEYLRGALEQKNLISGEEGPYGIFVKTVDGETVDDAKEQWWCFTRGGGTLMTGVDDTAIADGEHYEITFTTGW